MPSVTRREALRRSALAAGTAAALVPLELVESAVGADPSSSKRKLKVVVAGGHPDDPETGGSNCTKVRKVA